MERGTQSSERVSWIVLVEDNPGDVALVREALYEYDIRSELTVIFDGEKAFELSTGLIATGCDVLTWCFST
jgi:hypothetical protein